MDIAQVRPARANPLLCHPRELRVPLDGVWRFRLDPQDHGRQKGWFRRAAHLPDQLRVPGCWQGQGFGGSGTDRLWDFGLEARVFRATYHGSGWYGRTVRLPEGWAGKRIWLNFGGAHPSAEVWLDGVRLGENCLPFVPFAFEVSSLLAAGAGADLVVRVHELHRQFGLAYSWQGNWSGLYRGVDLTATGPCWFTRCAVLPDVDGGAIGLRLAVGGQLTADTALHVRAIPLDGSRPACLAQFPLDAAESHWRLPVPQPLLWSPDDPRLYRVDLELRQGDQVCDARTERTGFVRLDARGKRLCINGEPYYLRGTGDFLSCPETGSPDTDRQRWQRKLRTLREYGYNYVRCQSYVYGPEYYDAADEVGLLVQSEMGLLGAWGGMSPWHAYQWPKPTADNLPHLQAQWDLVVERDACHPSANLYCMSNELGRSTDFARLAWTCYRRTKAAKPTAMVLWTDGGYHPDLPGDIVNHTVAALSSDELAALDKPLVEHEYRWWSSFPDVRLRPKYAGAVRPYAAELAAAAAAARGQAHLLEACAANSQRLQLAEAKAKMELMRRDQPGLAGICHFNAMDTNPSPQGIVDEFYEVKLATAQQWRQTNGDTVVLCSLAFDERCWTAGRPASVKFMVSDWAHPPFRAPRLDWRLTCQGQLLAGGELRFAAEPFTTVGAGQVDVVLPPRPDAAAALLEATLCDGESRRRVTNRWAVWLFPPPAMPAGLGLYGQPQRTWAARWTGLPTVGAGNVPTGTRVLLAETIDPTLAEFARAGGCVVLAAGEGMVRPHPALFGYVRYFFTPPANYAPYEDGQSGTIVADHAALAGFPHEGFADWQFFRMVDGAPPVDLEPLGLAGGGPGGVAPVAAHEPVIRAIHRYPVMRPLAYLVERRLGAGGLIVCALELRPEWPEACWLLAGLCRYGGGAGAWADAAGVTPATLARLAAAASP